MYYLITTPACPYCPKAKLLVQEKKLNAILLDGTTPEGFQFARKYNISEVPTLIELDEAGKEIKRMNSITEIINGLSSCSLPDSKK